MKNLTICVSTVLLLATSPALAGKNNPEEAKAMASALKKGGGGNNSPLKDALGLEGKGGVAKFVSGGGNGGWGNVGSTLTGTPGKSVSGR
ncbi:hypothetical protein ALP8811_00892 [Aliiroseovarius pelagivivens]|uniref:Uncharacterized protein n=1 Tax=Aliiroseovarius pelagivivens TaxID=1639690 RepID=A0A2R8AIP6_9RHOB|nr:hypothetical protein [Aliiroseovarius pelagivivens]SPF75898.1 hypothetical protein ALP8811_00892 [Aliiroseovarius pelagivivens]